MRYREIDALLREAESRLELAAALKDGKAAKEFRKEREALETAVGGKKRLDEADKILSSAENESAKIIASAETEVRGIVRVADDNIKAEVQALEKKEAGLAVALDDAVSHKKANKQKSLELENAALAIKGREETANDRDLHLNNRESKVIAGEEQIVVREREVTERKQRLEKAW
ncbi:MAG TPA: hypothetical protein ENH62_06135 [Marinobacter sp.]|uniref:Uncharacterized protein n=1 Tax=marine sediment metagenome TaxID=412755 RepID=A0A0F9TTN9_9ZZZZ|nr:hypothetical protein [Marinobacter sp.]